MRRTKQGTHPLADTFYDAQKTVGQIRARLRTPTGSGWMRPKAFYQASWLESMCADIGREYETNARTTVAQIMCAGYQWGLVVTALACYRFYRRVPDLCPEKLWFHWNSAHSYVDEIAYESGAFACLQGDPASSHPDAVVVSNQRALRDHLRRELVSHFKGAFEPISRFMGIRPHGLWLSLADRCAATLLWLEQERTAGTGGVDAASDLRDDVQALFAAPHSPLQNKVTEIIPIHVGSEHVQLCVKRATCCHAYRLDRRDYCDNCPHLPREEMQDRICAAFEQRANKLVEA